LEKAVEVTYRLAVRLEQREALVALGSALGGDPSFGSPTMRSGVREQTMVA
jgi:hypothetical protein